MTSISATTKALRDAADLLEGIPTVLRRWPLLGQGLTAEGLRAEALHIEAAAAGLQDIEP